MIKDIKFLVLTAAMTLIGLATAGFSEGLDTEDGIVFGLGLLLLAIYHWWFDTSTQIIRVLKKQLKSITQENVKISVDIQKQTPIIHDLRDQITLLKTETIALKEEILTLRSQVLTLKNEIFVLKENANFKK
jgi:septal ring factor EnvC (AmiA/AmiB activator)